MHLHSGPSVPGHFPIHFDVLIQKITKKVEKVNVLSPPPAAMFLEYYRYVVNLDTSTQSAQNTHQMWSTELLTPSKLSIASKTIILAF